MSIEEKLILERSKLTRDVIICAVKDGNNTSKQVRELLRRALVLYDDIFFPDKTPPK